MKQNKAKQNPPIIERDSYTFLAEWGDSIRELPSLIAQVELRNAIDLYCLKRIEPDFSKTESDVPVYCFKAVFKQIKPKADVFYQKFVNGKQNKGKPNEEQTESEQEANEEQTESKQEANEEQTESKRRAKRKQAGSETEANGSNLQFASLQIQIQNKTKQDNNKTTTTTKERGGGGVSDLVQDSKPTLEELTEFVKANNLQHTDPGRLLADLNESEWKDKDGVQIRSWQKYVRAYDENRASAGKGLAEWAINKPLPEGAI